MKSESSATIAVLFCCAMHTACAADVTVNVIDPAGRPLRQAVVYARPLGRLEPPPATRPHAVIDQVNRQFVPLVSVVRTGTEISFPNSDNIRHSIYSFSPPKVFNTKLYSGRQAAPVSFDQPGLVVLGCNIHDTMAAWLVIVDTPFFGASGSDGTVVMRGMPEGEYELNAWYPAPQLNPLQLQFHVAATDQKRTVTLDPTGSPLLPLLLRAQNSAP